MAQQLLGWTGVALLLVMIFERIYRQWHDRADVLSFLTMALAGALAAPCLILYGVLSHDAVLATASALAIIGLGAEQLPPLRARGRPGRTPSGRVVRVSRRQFRAGRLAHRSRAR